MLRHTLVLTACAVAIATLLTTSSTQAQGPIRTNYVTFNSTVALPGVVLAPGKYAFESGPNGTDRAIVRVMSADRQRGALPGVHKVSHPSRGHATGSARVVWRDESRRAHPDQGVV